MVLGMALSGAIDVWAIYLAISDGLCRAKDDDAELSEIITCLSQPSDGQWLFYIFINKTSSRAGDLSHIWSLRKTQGLKREPHSISALMVSQSWWFMETQEKRSRLWTLLKRWYSWMQTSGSSRWRFCNILFLPTASFRLPNKLASWELWTLRHSGTATKPGNTDGGEKDRRSHFSSRITKWIRKIRLCIPSVHQQSSQDTENAQHKPNSAADSGHKLQRKDQKLLTAAWSVQHFKDVCKYVYSIIKFQNGGKYMLFCLV